MLLAVDIGNTSTQIAVFDNHLIVSSWRLSSVIKRTDDEYWFLLCEMFSSASITHNKINSVAISSVVPGLTRIFSDIFHKKIKINPLVISHKHIKHLKIDYNPISAVGADRLCGAVAGVKKYGTPLILIDMGTATVFDIVSDNNVYIGGLIAPGLLTAADSLHYATAQLPKVELEFPSKVIATDTVSSIQSGILYGALAMIDGIVDRIKNEMKADASVVATGGFSNLIKPYSKAINYIESNLVLEGIDIIASDQ